ncbi:hypothetical protein L1887_63295 [Cichorium endivia]|nr:hypothetical protein L1887_63295 [Cichorium endivia]
MFSFPSRHHPLPRLQFLSSPSPPTFQHPTGLHPKLDLTFPAELLKPPQSSCRFARLHDTLPSSLFIDQYQFSDELFLQSQNLVALRALSGEQDLEAPEWVVKSWGSAALFELAHPASANAEGDTWIATIPTHLRYVRNRETRLHRPMRKFSLPAPVVFWACNAEEGTKCRFWMQKAAGWVPMATMAVVLAGFTWVVWKLIGGGGGRAEAKTRQTKKKE